MQSYTERDSPGHASNPGPASLCSLRRNLELAHQAAGNDAELLVCGTLLAQ
jgi:hypothetical protein